MVLCRAGRSGERSGLDHPRPRHRRTHRHGKSLPEQRMIVGDKDAFGHASAAQAVSVTGRLARR